MRKIAAGLLVGMLTLALVAAATLLGLYRASQQVPPFYERALATAATDPDRGDRFERQALALHKQVRHAGHWEARFSEDEINGWLAAALPDKFPQALASGISDPRVAIEGEVLRLALRYQRGSNSTV